MTEPDIPAVPTVLARDLHQWIGRPLHSPWFRIDQSMITQFADLTLDRNWVHVDIARAQRERGGTIAHGFLSLSLLGHLSSAALHIGGYASAMNYGFDKLRFTAPVSSGGRVRLRMTIASVDARGAGLLLRRACVMEIEANDRPAFVGDWITLLYPED